MVISHSKKFIFIHNTKVAGTSIEAALRPFANMSFRHSSYLDKLLILCRIYPKYYSADFSQHVTLKELKRKLPPDIFDNYFKFGFVRNPWDWQVSLYTYMLKEKAHHQHKLIKRMKNFDEYIEWRVHEEPYLQKDFFYDENNCEMVDYIGRYENISSDMTNIFNKFNLHARLPHVNKSRSNSDFLSFYSQKSIDMVHEAFKEDIAIFGYAKPVI